MLFLSHQCHIFLANLRQILQPENIVLLRLLKKMDAKPTCEELEQKIKELAKLLKTREETERPLMKDIRK